MYNNPLFEQIKAGNFEKTPIGVSELTLKIGKVVDANPSTDTLREAIDCLYFLLNHLPKEIHSTFGVSHVIFHKMEYLLEQYGIFIPKQELQEHFNYIKKSKEKIVKTLQAYPKNTELDVLQTVIEMNEDGSSMSTIRYEIGKMTIGQILENNCDLARFENVKSQQQVDGVGTPRPSGGSDDNNNTPPPPPSWFMRNVPHVPPVGVGASLPPDDDKNTSYTYTVDVLQLVCLALLHEMSTGIKTIDGGVQISIRNDVLSSTFESHQFDYSFIKDKDRPFLIPTQSTSFYTSGGLLYFCQVIEKMGLAPQIADYNSVIVRAEPEKLRDLKLIKDDLSLNAIWINTSHLVKDALDYIAIQGLAKKIRQRSFDTEYTAYKANKYWEKIEQEYQKYYANMNQGGRQ